MRTASDLTVIGSGLMGLFTAVYAARDGAVVTLVDESYVGNPATASFCITRSVRNDYLDIEYGRLAVEARRLWAEFQRESEEELVVYTGMLNIVKASITPDFSRSWAHKTFSTLQRLRTPAEALNAAELNKRFPQFNADDARLDVDAGFAYVPAVTSMLRRAVIHENIQLLENTSVESIRTGGDGIEVATSAGIIDTNSLVITAGHGTNDVLSRVEGNSLICPTSRDRPSENKYFTPPKEKAHMFTPDKFPAFACLDVGIYGHPWIPGKTKGVKVGYYNPTDAATVDCDIDGVEKFVAECIPMLSDAEVSDVTEVDQCDYDLVSDDDFILGKVPGLNNVYIGTGWRGTGYKYGPLVGRVLSQLALQDGTLYDIARFDPARFTNNPTTINKGEQQ